MMILIKNLLRRFLFSQIVCHLLLFPMLVMGQNSWEDGNPLFVRPYYRSSNILVPDSTIQLIPTTSESRESESFLFILSGIDWKWPVAELGLPAAEDIDYRRSRNNDYYLVTDGTERRIFEINVATKLEVWEFKSAEDETSPRFIRHPTDAFYFVENNSGKILITDQGRNRIIKVDKESKDIEWSYGDTDAGLLSSPTDAITLTNTTHILICDRGNNRIIVVAADSTVVWEWGQGILNKPVDVEYQAATSQILVTDQQNHRVILVSYPDSTIDFEFGLGRADSTKLGLNTPTDADILTNGNILICDAGNKRLIEVNRSGNIVWAFHRPLEELKDADRLPDDRTLAIFHDSLHNKILPARLAYKSAADSSKKRDLKRKVIFDSLYWEARTAIDTTNIKLQLRTASSYADLESAPWMGPNDAQSYYTTQPAAINPYHNGDRWYQFKALLETKDPLHTPSLSNVVIKYHYFNIDCTGIIISEPITDEPGMIIISWDSLIYRTKLPPSENRDALTINFHILDAKTNADLVIFEADRYAESDTIILSKEPKLSGVQAIKLKATLNTSNSSITPILRDWRITWSNTASTKSALHFVDADDQPVTHYRVSTRYEPGQKYVDWVKLSLFDGDLIPLRNEIELVIRARLSRDSLRVKLIQQAGIFKNEPGKPAIVSEFVDFENSILEVINRDTLIAIYRDLTDPTDSDTAQVVMVLNTDAQIQFENRFHAVIDSAYLNDTVYVRITGEFDQDLSPGQDTVDVTVADNENGEEEVFAAVEQPDTLGRYSTGEFLTEGGILLVRDDTGVRRDGLVQTNAGRRVIARYVDNGTVTATIRIPTAGEAPPIVVVSLNRPYDFIIAPNPFYANTYSRIRLRAASTIGDMRLKSIEIFNLAGEKIRHLDGEAVFASGSMIQRNRYATAENWWDFTTDSGHTISSGTYWIKFNADLFNSQDGNVEGVSMIKKVLILR